MGARPVSKGAACLPHDRDGTPGALFGARSAILPSQPHTPPAGSIVLKSRPDERSAVGLPDVPRPASCDGVGDRPLPMPYFSTGTPMNRAKPLPFVILVVLATVALFVKGWSSEVPTGGEIDTGDVAWMLTASALVLLMTPGLSFFYGGMVGFKNVVSTMLQSVIALGVISLLWVARRLQPGLRRQHRRPHRQPADLLHVRRRRRRDPPGPVRRRSRCWSSRCSSSSSRSSRRR